MMKWKVTKAARSSSVDRSVDCEVSEVSDAAKFLPALPGLSKAEQVRKDDAALHPPGRRKHQQNGGFGVSRKDSFAASDCIPINLREILGISRQRSESNLNSLPFLNGERRRSRSEVRISSTDRLTVAYHTSQVVAPHQKLTERNQTKTEKLLSAPNGRCSSPIMKNSRWLRGRQRQRDPKKTPLGVCGGVSKPPIIPPNDGISIEETNRKNWLGSETTGLVNSPCTEKPKKQPDEITDQEKLSNSKDINCVTSRLNCDTEKELDKENIKIRRKATNEGNKQGKEGYKFRRNKGVAPRPGMRRSPNENNKNSNILEDQMNAKTVDIKSCSGNPSAKAESDRHHQHEANGIVSHSVEAQIPAESVGADDQANAVLESQKNYDGDTSKHCAKKRKDSNGAVVTLISETRSESSLLDASRQKQTENVNACVPRTANTQKYDFTEWNNERNNKYSLSVENESESNEVEERASRNCLVNGDSHESTNSENGVLCHKDGKSQDSRLKSNGFVLHVDAESTNEDLQTSQDHFITSTGEKSNANRNSEFTTKSNHIRHNNSPEQNSDLITNAEQEKDTANNPTDKMHIERNLESIYENVPNGDVTKPEAFSKEHDICTVESKESLEETMLDSLAPAEEQIDYMDSPMDTCSKVTMYYPPSPPPKKKLAAHQGMTVSVVVRKPPTSEESPKPLACRDSEISTSESFVVKKSFVLTIAKQEMGFRSMCASKESSSQALETTAAGVKKEEHQISVTFLCSGNVKEPWISRQASVSPMNDVRLRSFSMPPISRYQQQDLLCLESIRSRSRERRNREKQSPKKKTHRQRKKDPGFHMPKAVIDELSKVLEKRKRSMEDDDEEDDDDDDYDEDGDSE